MQRAGFFVGAVIAHLVAVAGCYQPELRDCTVQCAAPTDCTGGQVCRNDGWCAMPGAKKCPEGGAAPDGGGEVTRDAAPDSLDLCPMGCTNGTCDNGVCVIDCTAPFSCLNGDVVCPANLPCRVNCGDNSCAKKIICGMATSCEVNCQGEDACVDEIHCNNKRCDVNCTGFESCKKRTRCANSCACDVSCIGIGSCAEPSECSESACRLGNGCSSLLTGCDDC
ncbi:MAG TPA: hypothetical protein VIV11_37350 [Kofleriaceae bacterium]